MIGAGSAILVAHHGMGAFYDNTRSVEASGTISKFIYKNPHSALYFTESSADRRSSVEWEVELGPAAQLARMGLTPGVLKPGVKIRAKGQPSRTAGRHAMCCATLTGIDGTPLVEQAPAGLVR